MIQIIKQTLQHTARKFGYEIREISKKRKPKPQAPLGHERTREEYDLIWSDSEIQSNYISDKRKTLYNTILDYTEGAGFLEREPSIADVGCGPGYLIRYVYDRYGYRKLVGFDFSEKVLEIACEMCPESNFHRHDIYEPLEGKFDLLFCTEVLEHLAYPQNALDKILENATNVVLSVPNGRTDTYSGHVNYWSLESWNVFLEPHQNLWQIDAKYACNDENILTTLKRLQ